MKRAALRFSWSFRRRRFEKLGLQGIQSLIGELLGSGLVPIVAIKTDSNYLLSEVHALFYSNAPMDEIANIFFASLTICGHLCLQSTFKLASILHTTIKI